MLYSLIIMLSCFCVVDFLKNKKVYTPIFLYNSIWLITILLYQLKLSYLQQNLSPETLKIFLVAVLSYNLGYIFFSLFRVFKNKARNNYHFTIDKKINIANIIIAIIFIIEIIYSGGFPFLWKIIGSSKIYFDYGIPSIHGAFNGLVICLGAYSLYKKPRKCIPYILIGILILSRQVIMSIFIEGIICILIKNNKIIKWKKIFGYVIVILLFFTLLGNFRSGKDTMNNIFKPKDGVENISVTTKWIYSYTTFSLSNFNNLVSITHGNINKGASMANDLLPSAITSKINFSVKYKFNYLISPNYTASTYLVSSYLDYGVGGIILINVVISFIGYILYRRILYNTSSKEILSYSVFTHNIILLFFTNMFLYLPIIIQLFYIPIIFSEREDNSI